MFENINIKNIATPEKVQDVANMLGMIMMSAAALAMVTAESTERRAVVPQQAVTNPYVEPSGEGSREQSRRERESEVHETHVQARVNQRTPARSGRA